MRIPATEIAEQLFGFVQVKKEVAQNTQPEASCASCWILDHCLGLAIWSPGSKPGARQQNTRQNGVCQTIIKTNELRLW